MSAHDIAREAISRMNKKITNEIFKIIQNDRDLMKMYLTEVQNSTLGNVNRAIGREVKNAYRLTNIDDRKDDPTCTLIQTHQKFE